MLAFVSANGAWLVLGLVVLAVLLSRGGQGAGSGTGCTGDSHMGTQSGPGATDGHLAHHRGNPDGMAGAQSMHDLMMGSGADGHMAAHETMHPVMVAAFAERIGLEAGTVEARLEAGNTMRDIGRAQGLSDVQITRALTEAHNAALDEAVAQGVLTDKLAQTMRGHAMDAEGRHGADQAAETAAPGQATHYQPLHGLAGRLASAWDRIVPW